MSGLFFICGWAFVAYLFSAYGMLIGFMGLMVQVGTMFYVDYKFFCKEQEEFRYNMKHHPEKCD